MDKYEFIDFIQSLGFYHYDLNCYKYKEETIFLHSNFFRYRSKSVFVDIPYDDFFEFSPLKKLIRDNRLNELLNE